MEQRYSVYTLNLPIAKNIHSYRDAVMELIKQKGLDRVIIVGWSMGALVAIQVAHQLSHNVQGLVLVSGTSRFLADLQVGNSVLGRVNTREREDYAQNGANIESYQGGISATLIVRMKKRLSKNCGQTVTEFCKLMFSNQEQVRGLAGEIIPRELSRARRWDLIEAQAGLDFLVEADVRAELKGITCPTLLVHGDQDEICPLGGAEFIQRQIPGAQLIIYPGVGHIPFLTYFEGFHRALEGWLASYDDK